MEQERSLEAIWRMEPGDSSAILSVLIQGFAFRKHWIFLSIKSKNRSFNWSLKRDWYCSLRTSVSSSFSIARFFAAGSLLSQFYKWIASREYLTEKSAHNSLRSSASPALNFCSFSLSSSSFDVDSLMTRQIFDGSANFNFRASCKNVDLRWDVSLLRSTSFMKWAFVSSSTDASHFSGIICQNIFYLEKLTKHVVDSNNERIIDFWGLNNLWINLFYSETIRP